MQGLTEDEQHAMDLTGQLGNLLSDKVIGHGPTREGDLREMALHVHTLQNFIMAQSAARAHPDKYRLLGETVGQ